MYSLVSRVPAGMEELRKKFEYHVQSQGLSAIEKCGDTVINVSCRGQFRCHLVVCCVYDRTQNYMYKLYLMNTTSIICW